MKNTKRSTNLIAKRLQCKHCNKQIDQVTLRGLSLICPFCGNPQNGHLIKT